MTDSTLNSFLARGTSTQRGAFTPSPPTPASGPSPTYIWHETDTGDTYAYNGTSWDKVNTSSGGATASPIGMMALDGIDGEEGMPIPGAPGAAAAGGASALTLLGSATSTGVSGALTVSGIPGTSKDLVVVILGATTDTASQLTTIAVNGAPNGDMQRLYAQGGTVACDQLLNAAALNLFTAYPGSGYTAGMAGSQEMTFFEYANTSFWKNFHFVGRQPNNVSSGNAYTMTGNGQFRTTSAITSITSTLAAGNWVAGSVMRVYGRT